MWKRDESAVRVDAHRSVSAETGTPESRSAERMVMDLGKSVIIKGDLSASEDLTLYGQMAGSITLPDYTLTIGPHANIKASISAKAVVIMGTVTGNVTARERIEIGATGSVHGDIASPRFVVADGAHLRGKVEMPNAGSTTAV